MHPRAWLAAVVPLTLASLAAGGVAPASSTDSAPTAARASDGVTKYPQDYVPNEGNELTRVGHTIWFTMIGGQANTKIGRMNQQGKVRVVGAHGPAYAFTGPVRTADGGVYVVVDQSEGSDPKGIALAGVDPSTWKVTTSTTKNVEPLAFWPMAADAKGRFWGQGNVVGKGIAVVGAGLDKSLKIVRTGLGPTSSQIDATVANPLVQGPDGHVWIAGPSNTGSDLHIMSIGGNGVRFDAHPARLRIVNLSLVQAGDRMWTLGAGRSGRLTAVGVDQTGAITRVRTDAFRECFTDSVTPRKDGAGGLWFTGADQSCRDDSELLAVKVSMNDGTAEVTDTGIGVLGDAASAVVKVSDGVVVAGRGGTGSLSFVRVAGTTTQMDTNLEPFLANEQTRYPMVGDKNDGAWAQGVNAKGNLVVVHVQGASAIKIPTGIQPVARDLRVGPDQALWTQGVNDGRLVIVKVAFDGTVTKYYSGTAPARFDFVTNGVYDGNGHMWFQGTKPGNGNLVLIRVRATG
jgi:hypothetical protein